jgi:predicted TIM-barrel fold metal-dependent hydrolase
MTHRYGRGTILNIDSHMHVNFKGLDAGGIVSYLDREGLSKCWLLTWEEVSPKAPVYMHLSADEMFDAYRRFPDRVCPMYAPDPEAIDAADKFMAWVDKGVCGCGELKTSLSWDSPKLDRLLEVVNGLGMPLVFHMETSGTRYAAPGGNGFEKLMAKMLNTPRYLGYPRKVINFLENVYAPLRETKEKMRSNFPGYMTDFAALETRLRQFPRIRFIGHGPLFWEGISLEGPHEGVLPRGRVVAGGITVKLMDEYDNLSADLSGYSGYRALTRDPEFARQFIIRHSGKLLYGTDNFFLGLKPFLESLKLPEGAARRIYGENALRLTDGGGGGAEGEAAGRGEAGGGAEKVVVGGGLSN